MPNDISTAELLSLVESGATVKTPERVDPFKEGLLAQLKAIAASQAAQAKQTQAEVVAAINALAKVLASKQHVDMGPVLAVLDDIKKNGQATPEPKPAYTFTVHRDRKGLMTRVEATPAEEKTE